MSDRESEVGRTEAEKKANLTVNEAFIKWKLAEKRAAMAKQGHRQADIREFHARHRSEAARTGEARKKSRQDTTEAEKISDQWIKTWKHEGAREEAAKGVYRKLLGEVAQEKGWNDPQFMFLDDYFEFQYYMMKEGLRASWDNT